MTPPTALASKGLEVEEWADRRFFRPIGYALACRLMPSRIRADQVTAGALVLGLIAGHLFVYRDPWLNLAGLTLFVASDVLDSADGQLARLRRTSSRTGRVLDGLSDSLRFINLYAHLLIRLLLAGGGWPMVTLALAALVSHSFQSAAVDFVRNAYLALGLGRDNELDLPTATRAKVQASTGGGIIDWLYADYVRRQALLFPHTMTIVGLLAGDAPPPALREVWRARQASSLRIATWIGQNIRFALLIAACAAWPAGFLWITALPLNLVLVALVLTHERAAQPLLSPLQQGVVTNA